jgi:glycosyltransferase involved in cell wall biosynthesis
VAACIERLLSDPALAARLAACARSRVEKDFTIGKMVNETIQVYERMLS